ncbi:7056_t:CDS:2, partial [Gigaspora margarita]
ATKREVREIFFNEPLGSATIFLSSSNNDTKNLGTPGVVLISEKNYRRIIANLANTKGKEPEDNLDSDILSQFDELMFDTQTNETDTSNLEENQWTENSQINDYFKFYKRKMNNKQSKNFSNDFENNEETDKLTASINVTTNTFSQANSIFDNECINDNQIRKFPFENNISRMLEQTTQGGVIGSIQNNNHEDNFDIGNDNSPEWLECEDCYRNKKELYEYWGCSVCKWKSDKGHILLYDETLTLHNDNAINDSNENRVESTNFPIVVIEKNGYFSSTQQIDETENMLVTQSDTNIQESFTQLNSSRISTSLYLVNQVEGSIDKDNTSDEESQSLQ